MTKSLFVSLTFVFSLLLSCGTVHIEGSEVSQYGGKRVVGYLDDKILAKRWAVIEDDTHPEAPHTLVSMAPPSGSTRAQDGTMPPSLNNGPNVVHAGDSLTLFSDSPTLHLELAAVAIESAAQGGHLRVRLVRGGSILNGIVLSSHRVKLQSSPQRFDNTQGAMQ